MRTLIVYSSLTGNTKKVAEAIAQKLSPCDLHPVESAPAADGYDFVAVGYWVDKGMPDAKCLAYMRGIKNSKVALFGTLGAYPDSDHAKECIAKSEAVLCEGDSNNTVLGSFLCQGKVDPKVVEMMMKKAPKAHPMTPERIARLKEAESHPDEQDCRNAQEALAGFLAKAKG